MGYTKEGIVERMKTPEVLTPRETFESYAFLAATLAEEQMALAELEGKLAQAEATYIEDGRTSAAATALTKGSETGIAARKLRASVTGLLECIRALKRAQGYFQEEARNQY